MIIAFVGFQKVFSMLINLLMSLEIQPDFVKFIANICEQTTNFYYKSSAFWSFLFPRNHA